MNDMDPRSNASSEASGVSVIKREGIRATGAIQRDTEYVAYQLYDLVTEAEDSGRPHLRDALYAAYVRLTYAASRPDANGLFGDIDQSGCWSCHAVGSHERHCVEGRR